MFLMIKTEFCFPQWNAENQYLLLSHCLHLQDIKEVSGAYPFRRWRNVRDIKKNFAENQTESAVNLAVKHVELAFNLCLNH